MVHGNSNENDKNHHLYQIIDNSDNVVFKYGISDDPLNEDGSSPRANTQVSLFNNVVGFIRFYATVLISGIKGRINAKTLENQYINEFEKLNGAKPRGNQKVNKI
jgi:hypothetical protein